jgi:hypothetical protein
MKKIKISGLIKDWYYYEWKFTEDEKEHLRTILKDFENHCVKDFISHLEHLCQCVLNLSKEKETYKRPSKQERRANINDTIKILNNALKEIKKIARLRTRVVIPYSLTDLLEYDGKQIMESQRLANGIKKELKELIDLLKLSPDLAPNQGNRTIREDFGAAIADAYMEHIARPTTTSSRNPKRGQFYDVLEFAFKAVGLPSEDVSKVARAVCPKSGYKHPKKIR